MHRHWAWAVAVVALIALAGDATASVIPPARVPDARPDPSATLTLRLAADDSAAFGFVDARTAGGDLPGETCYLRGRSSLCVFTSFLPGEIVELRASCGATFAGADSVADGQAIVRLEEGLRVVDIHLVPEPWRWLGLSQIAADRLLRGTG
ncbi:MAG TPA: hypothetical protein VFY23_16715 [Candidatus Limnocylindrales bacterium]|nr:hypothetical protein [Candidatus Limnocylindrales bacterium]